jgi:2-dehydropantoate 2-reductase
VRILVAGTGGVGGYYGGRLLHAGHGVRFIARGDNLRALREHGLTVHSPAGDLRFEQVHASEKAEEPVDAVLFCVKTYDTQEVADVIAPSVVQGSSICSLQNGVDNEVFLRERFPEATVLGGVARIEAYLEAPGVVRHTSMLADVEVGAFQGGDRSAAQALVDAMAGARIPARLAEDIGSALWTKLAIICGLGGVTAFCTSPIGVIRDDPELLRLTKDAIDETTAVAVALGILVPPTLTETVMTAVTTVLPPEQKSSMCRDVEAGKPLEVEALNGAVVKAGERTGLPTPANRRILDALLPLHRAAMERRALA